MTARTPRGAQKKGRQWELWVLKDLWACVGRQWPWKHQRPDDGHHPPPEFQDWHLEMKNQEKLNFWKAVDQASYEALKTGKDWCVVVKRSRTQPFVMIDYQLWKLMAEGGGRSI